MKKKMGNSQDFGIVMHYYMDVTETSAVTEQ